MKLVIDARGVVHINLEVPDHPFDLWLPGHVDAQARRAIGSAPRGAGVTCFICIEEWGKFLTYKQLNDMERLRWGKR